MNRCMLPLLLFLLCFTQDQVTCDAPHIVSLDKTDALVTVIYDLQEDIVCSALLIVALKCGQRKRLKAKAPVMLKIPFKRTRKPLTIKAQNYMYYHKIFDTSEISLTEDVVYLLSEDLYNQITTFKSDSVVHISYILPQEVAQSRWAMEDRWEQIGEQKKKNTPLGKRFKDFLLNEED